MQKIEIPYFDNTIKDVSGRLIPENVLQDSLNILFNNKKIKSRYGIQQLAKSLPEEILKIEIYRQLYSDISYVVAFTPSDIYYSDAGTWKYITRIFNKGTVTTSGTGYRTVTLTPATAVPKAIGTANSNLVSWSVHLSTAISDVFVGMLITGTNIPTNTYVARVDTANQLVYLSKPTVAVPSGTMTFTWKFRNTRWAVTNKYQIAFGYTDPNSVPASSWKTIASFSSDVICLLTEDATAITNSSFVIRLCYSASIDDRWNICFPYDESMEDGGDKALLATNGVDYLQKWQGFQDNTLTYFDDVYNYPNLCKQVEFYGTVGAEHIICSNVYDLATSSWNSTVIEVSDAGEISWEDGATYPLFDTAYPISGVVSLMTRIMIYKEKSISIAQPVYSDTINNPFDIQQDAIRTIGVIAIDTVCDTGKFHIFFTGDRICAFDGFNIKYVDDGVNLFISRIINPLYIKRSYAFIIDELRVYCLAIPTETDRPDTLVIYNYEENNFTFWRFYKDDTSEASSNFINMSCKGNYIVSYSPTWEEEIITGLTGSASASSTVTLSGTASGTIVAGMRIVPAGYTGDNLYIKSIASYPTVTVGTLVDESSIDPDDIVLEAVTITAGTSVEIGFTAMQSDERWVDLISEDSNPRHLFGGSDGKFYELSKYNGYDTINTVQYGIQSHFITKDFELNKGLTTLLREITLRVALLEADESTFFPGSLDIYASIDYGLNWSPIATLPLDGTETFMEKKIALHMRGKAVRFKVISELPFQLENCFIGFNIQGTSFKYDR